ncbi:MAG: acetate--CoA ligase family protein, partial [Desulfatitalea sp.]|nr:acetate--CoA ligase family protein [Desulfatitalea sp.]NNJ99353.1 acetate--CoA ligase family protein [Desulfatitalea sp.]
AGIVVIEHSDQLFPAVETLSSCPPIKNNKVAILADGGGHATIAADMLTEYGIELPVLEEKTQKKLRSLLPPAASVVNPVDVAGGTDADPSLFADCARAILNDPQVGGLLLVGLFGGYGIRFDESLSLKEEDAAHQMGKMVARRHKPIVIHSLYNSIRPHSLELCRYYNLPAYDSLDIACNCIKVLAQYGNYLRSYHAKTNFVLNWKAKAKAEGDRIIARAKSEGRHALLEPEAKQLFQLHGAPVPPYQWVESEEAAVAAAEAINGPVVMKIVSADILHKSDAGGVSLNINGKAQAAMAYAQLMKNAQRYDASARRQGVLVEPMASAGLEVIIGTQIDEQLGPIIMYGLGGIMVEILRDVSFRVLPISRHTARDMVAETKSAPILDGVRGTLPCDRKSLVNLLLTVSEIVEAYPQIHEMDLNPVIVNSEGIAVVDARVILTENEGMQTGESV